MNVRRRTAAAIALAGVLAVTPATGAMADTYPANEPAISDDGTGTGWLPVTGSEAALFGVGAVLLVGAGSTAVVSAHKHRNATA